MKIKYLIFVVLVFFCFFKVFPDEYIHIRDMPIFQEYTRNNMPHLSSYEGFYIVSEIINGNIDISHFGLDIISDIRVEMRFNDETKTLYISSNLDYCHGNSIDARSIFATVSIVAANGPDGHMIANISLTNGGVILTCHYLSRNIGVDYNINFLLEKVKQYI